MKQPEKLDFILKELFSTYKTTGDLWHGRDIQTIFKDKGLIISSDEADALGARLDSEGLIIGNPTKSGFYPRLTSQGIEYIEEDSFSKRGTPVTHLSFNINNSPGANIIHSSSNVSINTTSKEIVEILEKIYAAVQVSSEVDEELQRETLGRIDEIKEHIIATERIPNFALNDLLSKASDIVSIASFLISLKNAM